jgi:hypothetical protein
LYIFCSIQQIILFLFEIVEISFEGIYKYFDDMYNFADFLQPLLFFIHLGIRLKYGKIDGFEWS